MRTAVATRTAMLDAIRANLNNGYIRVYSGTRPAGPDTPAIRGMVAKVPHLVRIVEG